MRIARIPAALVAVFLCAGEANPQDNCRGFIEETCCCTNSCCWEIQASEVEPLEGFKWRIKATGQVVTQKDYSPDGRYYRCACDYDVEQRRWNRHQGANTRCIYVPMNAF